MFSMVLVAVVALAQTPPEVAEFLDSFVDSFNDLDWERFRRHFSDDATAFFPEPYPSERASGREAVEEGFRGVFDRWRSERQGPPYLDIDPQDVQVQSYGEVVVVSFHLREGESLSRRTLVLRRGGDGYRIVHLHASSR